MKYRILTETEKRRYGADVAVTVDYTDLATLANGNTGSFNIAPFTGPGTQAGVSLPTGNTLPAGTRMKLEMLELTAGFVFSDSGNACAINLGDSGSATRFVSGLSLISGSGTTFSLGTGTTNVLTSADNAILAFTGQSGHNLNTATAGSVTFWLRLDDFAHLPTP